MSPRDKKRGDPEFLERLEFFRREAKAGRWGRWLRPALVALVTRDSATGDLLNPPKYEAPIFMDGADKGVTDAEQTAFYRALLEIPWLESDVRRAVISALGVPVRAEKVKAAAIRTQTLAWSVAFHAEAIWAERERNKLTDPADRFEKEIELLRGEAGWPPKGRWPRGLREDAMKRVAEIQGISVDSLHKRLQRFRKTQRTGKRTANK
jgi:hypothetical protein